MKQAANSLSGNPLKTRSQVEAALMQLLEPVESYFTPGDAGIALGDFCAHYGTGAAEMEAYSRMLWGLAPYWVHCREERWFPHFRNGLIHGTTPGHPAYWGTLQNGDQKIVEMAAIVLFLLLHRERLQLSEREAANLQRWMNQVNGREIPHNNWLFFRVLVNSAFRLMGWDYDAGRLEADLQELDSFYLSNGWYFDGEPTQIDYYIAFGMHYYALIYAKFMNALDPERCARYKERAAAFAGDFPYWFEDSGAAVPFGRSLTYRFAQGAFFSALAFADVEGVDWGAAKSRALGNLCNWFSRPILDAKGLLTVGYGYPNLFMSENYNAPGSPYWACKAFLCLALPEDHPFWTAEEQVPQLEPFRVLPEARMLAARDANQVQLFPAGQFCVNQLGNCGAKYEKLVYSSRFGFSVPRGGSLEEGAFDCCLAVSEAGKNDYRMQRGFQDYVLEADRYWRKFSPMPGVTVEVTVVPSFPSHTRHYRITTDRPIDVADGGFSIAREWKGRLVEDAMVEQTADSVTVQAPWGVSGIICRQGGGTPCLVKAFPNTNLLHPITYIPTLCFHLEPGVHELETAVTGHIPEL